MLRMGSDAKRSNIAGGAVVAFPSQFSKVVAEQSILERRCSPGQSRIPRLTPREAFPTQRRQTVSDGSIEYEYRDAEYEYDERF